MYDIISIFMAMIMFFHGSNASLRLGNGHWGGIPRLHPNRLLTSEGLAASSRACDKLEGLFLVQAASSGDYANLKGLLTRVSVNTCAYNNKKTALMAAAASGQEKCVRILLAHGADIMQKDWAGRCVFHHVVDTPCCTIPEKQVIRMVGLLLEHYLHVCSSAAEERISLLCKVVLGRQSKDLVQTALSRHKLKLVRYFFDMEPALYNSEYLGSLLRTAVFCNSTDQLRLLLEYGVDPNQADTKSLMAYPSSNKQIKAIFEQPYAYIRTKQEELVALLEQAREGLPTELAWCIACMVFFLKKDPHAPCY